MRIFTSVVLLFLLTGCATSRYQQLNNPISKQSDEGSVVVCRTSGGHLLLRNLDVLVNQELVTDIRNASSIEIYTPAGKKEVRFKFPFDTSIRDIGLSLNVQNGKTNYVIVGTNLENFIVTPIGGFIRSSWSTTEVLQLPEECKNHNPKTYKIISNK